MMSSPHLSNELVVRSIASVGVLGAAAPTRLQGMKPAFPTALDFELPKKRTRAAA